jgi:hypothetical protein
MTNTYPRGKTMMTKLLNIILASLCLMFSCASVNSQQAKSGRQCQHCQHSSKKKIAWFSPVDVAAMQKSPHVNFIAGLRGYQQTTDYTCGPAALLTLAKYYGHPDMAENQETEMRIATEVGTRGFDNLKPGEKPGTVPDEMVTWLRNHGFEAEVAYEAKGDYSALTKLRENIQKKIPTIVEWVDLSGHWVIAVGYDDRGTSEVTDDVIIFADSYDKYDDKEDGYTISNADRFYWMWFDALYFKEITWRTMITATPKVPFAK